MVVDLKKDAKELVALLAARVEAHVARGRRVPTISAIEFGYCFDQDAWIFVHFDTRPEHARDGQWTNRFKAKDSLRRPRWLAAYELLGDGKPVTFVLPAGERLEADPKRMSDARFAGILGRTIRDAVLGAGKAGAFDLLPRAERCQIDVEEFNGNWAWPAYEKLGKVNVLKPRK